MLLLLIFLNNNNSNNILTKTRCSTRGCRGRTSTCAIRHGEYTDADCRRTTLKCSNLGGIHLVMGRCAESNVKRCFSEPYFAWSPPRYICLMKFSLHSSTAFHIRFQTTQWCVLRHFPSFVCALLPLFRLYVCLPYWEIPTLVRTRWSASQNTPFYSICTIYKAKNWNCCIRAWYLVCSLFKGRVYNKVHLFFSSWTIALLPWLFDGFGSYSTITIKYF